VHFLKPEHITRSEFLTDNTAKQKQFNTLKINPPLPPVETKNTRTLRESVFVLDVKLVSVSDVYL